MKDFIRDESGAVTVDWVVLTAAIIGLGGAGEAVVLNMDYYLKTYGTEEVNPRRRVEAVAAAINADAPDGYGFSGYYDTVSGRAVYYEIAGIFPDGNTRVGNTVYESNSAYFDAVASGEVVDADFNQLF
jgi:hypothetical protein